MRKYIFVIDGHGVESCLPLDSEIGTNEEFNCHFYGADFYKMRAALNWDRGCYYMEADIGKYQEVTLKQLIIDDKDWIGAKKFIENITGCNFETETGYENPFDPDWSGPFGGPEYVAKRTMWLRRAGLNDIALDLEIREKANQKSAEERKRKEREQYKEFLNNYLSHSDSKSGNEGLSTGQ